MALCKWHALTGSDTTGHIKGKSKNACLDAFLKSSPSIVDSVSALGTGNEPSDETIMGCVSFLSSLFCAKGISITQPHPLRSTLFKQQGTDKDVNLLAPTFGSWAEHAKRAHWQSAIWEQDLCLHPVVPDPTKLGWRKKRSDSCQYCQRLPQLQQQLLSWSGVPVGPVIQIKQISVHQRDVPVE